METLLWCFFLWCLEQISGVFGIFGVFVVLYFVFHAEIVKAWKRFNEIAAL